MKNFDFTTVDESLFRDMQQAELQAKQERLMAKFDNRFNNNRPFLVKYQSTRSTSNLLSYFFNAISLIGLLYAVQELLSIIPIPYLNWILAIGMLIGFEILKRKYSDLFWDHWWKSKEIQYTYGVINFVILFGISIAGSAFGMYFVATDHSPEAKQIGINDDPEAISLKERQLAIKDEIKEHRKNRNSKGEIYWPSQKAITLLTQEQLSITQTLEDKFGIFTIQNKDILNEWKLRKDFRAYAAIILTILFEILFEICMRFNSKYDYVMYLCFNKNRSYSMPSKKKLAEGTDLEEVPGASAGPTPPSESSYSEGENESVATGSYQAATEEMERLEVKTLLNARRRLKADQDAWKSKERKGVGRSVTNNKHITELDLQLNFLDQKLIELGHTV